jgi:hypothetical protein
MNKRIRIRINGSFRLSSLVGIMRLSSPADPLILQRAILFQRILWYSKLRIFPQNISIPRRHITLRIKNVFFRMEWFLSNTVIWWSGQTCANYNPVVHIKISILLLLLLLLLLQCNVRHTSIVPYFSIDNAHLMYNAHPKFFRHSFWCIDNARDAN